MPGSFAENLREIAEGDAPAFKFPLAPSACLSFLFRFSCLPDPLLFAFCHLRFWDEGMKTNVGLILLTVSLLVSSVLPPPPHPVFFSFFRDLSVFFCSRSSLFSLFVSVSWFFFSPSFSPPAVLCLSFLQSPVFLSYSRPREVAFTRVFIGLGDRSAL